MLRIFLLINALLQLVLFVMALKRLKRPGFQTMTLPLMFIFGAFVWEDMFILSLFWLIGSLVLYYFNSMSLTITFILLFVTLREFYEVLYWLFQQFHQTNFRPYDFGLKTLNNNSIYIIYQVASFSVASLSLFLLIVHLTS